MRTKISIGFSKKRYNDLGKHGFSRLLPMTIYHKVSHRADHEDNDNWLLYTWQHKGEKQAIQRKDGGMNAYFWVLFIMQALSVFWKKYSYSNEKLKNHQHPTWERHKGVPHADRKRHSSVWASLLQLGLVRRVQTTALLSSSSVMQTTSSAEHEVDSNMWKGLIFQ